MQAIETPLIRVSDAAKFFVQADELRVLHVLTSTSLRVAALDSMAVAEHLAANTRVFVTLEIPPDGENGGFDLIAEELRADLTDLRDSFLEENPASTLLRPLPPPVTDQTGIARFGAELYAAARSVSAPITGLVVVLAPVEIHDPKAFSDAVAMLVARPEFASLKFVVVDLDEDVCGAALRRFGAVVDFVDARLDEAEAASDARAMLQAMKAAPPGSSARARSGLAAPRVTPPVRKKAAAPTSTAQTAATLASLGVPPAVADQDAMQQLRVAIMEAAQAMRGGDPASAVTIQRRAVELAERAGLADQALTLDLMAGAYALQGGATAAAITHFRRVLARASEDQAQVRVQAQLYIGSALLLESRHDEAVVAYAEAGAIGVHANLPVFAIEGYRMAGQLLIDRGRPDEAAQAMNRAIGIGTSLPPDTARGTSAAEAARALAKLCRRHGLVAQAQSLIDTAKRLEAPPEPVQGAS